MKSFASKSVPPAGATLDAAAAPSGALSCVAAAAAAGAAGGDCASASAGLLMLSAAHEGGEACLNVRQDHGVSIINGHYFRSF